MDNKLAINDGDQRPKGIQEAHRRLDRLHAEIVRLGLERHVMELELYGYTIVEDAMPIEFFDQLRETILTIGEEDRQAGKRIPLSPPDGHSYLVTWLLARGRVFEQALMSEKPLALITWLMGESCQVSSNHGHVRVCGDPIQGFHTDSPLMPDPLPDAPVSSNSMWVLDDFTEESGATLVVPGSHRKRTNPPGDAEKLAIPITAKKGSVIVFSGNLWHSAGARTIPGERVGMTIYFNRMYARPQEELSSVISDEVVNRNPPRFAHLVGRDNPYPAEDFNFFNLKGAKYFAKTTDRHG